MRSTSNRYHLQWLMTTARKSGSMSVVNSGPQSSSLGLIHCQSTYSKERIMCNTSNLSYFRYLRIINPRYARYQSRAHRRILMEVRSCMNERTGTDRGLFFSFETNGIHISQPSMRHIEWATVHFICRIQSIDFMRDGWESYCKNISNEITFISPSSVGSSRHWSSRYG